MTSSRRTALAAFVAGHGTWRPFQLAFLLLTAEPSINEDSDHRDLVDLIWFPTGGGKTEAYLALMAFLICWRRMRYGTAGGGTTVLMRCDRHRGATAEPAGAARLSPVRSAV